MSVHILSDNIEAAARCYDLHDEELKTLVQVDLFAFLPWSYGEDLEDPHLPSWQFVIEAMRSCAEHEELLWQTWEDLQNDQLY